MTVSNGGMMLMIFSVSIERDRLGYSSGPVMPFDFGVTQHMHSLAIGCACCDGYPCGTLWDAIHHADFPEGSGLI